MYVPELIFALEFQFYFLQVISQIEEPGEQEAAAGRLTNESKEGSPPRQASVVEKRKG